MKKLLIPLLLIVLLYLSCGGNSPTSPNPNPNPNPTPKPQGIYTVNVTYTNGGYDHRICSFFVVANYQVANTNNVGASITSTTIQILYKGNVTYSHTFTEPDTISANYTNTYTYSTGVKSATPSGCNRPGGINVLVNLHDNNGYDHSILSNAVSIDYTYLPISLFPNMPESLMRK